MITRMTKMTFCMTTRCLCMTASLTRWSTPGGVGGMVGTVGTRRKITTKNKKITKAISITFV